jgi:hypothetical protein
VLGQTTLVVTERCARLRADLFSPADLGRVAVDLSPAMGKIVR